MATGLLARLKQLIWPAADATPATLTIQETVAASTKKSRRAYAENAGAGNQPAEPTLAQHLSADELHRQFHQSVFACPTIHNQKLSVPQTLVLQVVESNLRSAEYRIKSVPRLPSVVPQLLKSLRDPNSSASQYVDIIKQDPVIAGAVLKMANSAYFNPTGTYMDSFQRAVVTLGIQGLRSLLSTAVMQPIIYCKSIYFLQFGKKLWDHSVCCAIACQIIANHQGLDPFKAYLLGLTHDIGKITLFTQLAQQFKLNSAEAVPPVHAFVHLMDKMDLELSYSIARDWGFPDDILQGLKDQIEHGNPAKMSSLGSILFSANQGCEAYLLNRNESLEDQKAELLLEKLNLPADLFEQLDSVFITVEV